MKPLSDLPIEARRAVRFVLCDIDDTITDHGRLPGSSLGAMERLQAADITVMPVTGRPAGWCDHIARMWPVGGVVGENGALFFRYDRTERRMHRRYWKDDEQRAADREKLAVLAREIAEAVPGCAVAADQPYREADLAIDFAEDVDRLPDTAIRRIVTIFEAAGATAKVSSIHVNGWFGDFDKLSMTRRAFAEFFARDIDGARDDIVFVGDSPNDAPMFGFFPNAVGVANVRDFAGRLAAEPAWVTDARGAAGFAELADAILETRQDAK
ncbi:MAG: HAD-IIB family hydrolase [Alphaproteobacteria bacterium]|nr:HAD-IIB family hydrolase [Alphaproteobacteria bacterium]